MSRPATENESWDWASARNMHVKLRLGGTDSYLLLGSILGRRNFPAAAVIFSIALPPSERPMGFTRHTSGITPADLTRDCLRQLRLWPGCETVVGIAVLAAEHGRFTVHVVEYGRAPKRTADQAIRCIQREKSRHYHLKIET